MDRNMHRFMTKDDYKAAGARHHADPTGNPTSYRRGVDVSWQAKAFWEGYDAQAKKKAPAAVKPGALESLSERNRDYFKAWPGAAAEHFINLSHDLASEKNLARLERLNKALTRMQKRYGHLCASTSSNQPAA